MASSMAMRPQPGRTQPGIKSTRFIPPSLWEQHLPQIKQKYTEEGMPLAELMEFMRKTYGFDQTLVPLLCADQY